jgi:starch synthase (maltosyl-transferring)
VKGKDSKGFHHRYWSPLNRIVIEGVRPELDGGRYPVKRIVGETFEVWADIFCDGHDILGACVKYREQDRDTWQRAPMRLVDNDRWSGQFELIRNCRYVYTIEAWTDVFASWRRDTAKKRDAGVNIELELVEGLANVKAALASADGRDAGALKQLLADIDGSAGAGARAQLLLAEHVGEIVGRRGDRADLTAYYRELELVVDRKAARFAAWYEMFPRSQGTVPDKGATFNDCIKRLPEVRDMGFDVLYFVPIHPIGRVNRKGANNSLNAGPSEPGSPYAIGSKEGGHTAVHPDLGTLDDFKRLVAAANDNGLEVALDFAIQCAPDHPWVAEHKDWFKYRPDGTIKYAENPPKKYQDIVNIDFYGPEREAIWTALRDIVLFWVDNGVKTFRVDNPHTKPVPFWEWMIREVQTAHPDVIFLAEAFTRPKVLKALAKAGFTQSYSYFTWRNFKNELTEYLTELTQTECREYLQPNFFTCTPDILPPILQRGGRPAFQMRLVLAATLSSVYGIYNGYELCENGAIPDTEEYKDSEKYQYKVWDWNRPGNIKNYVGALNRARRENPALHDFQNLRFYAASSDSILFYGKMTADRSNMVFVAVNLDPFEAHEAAIEFPLGDMNVGADDAFEVEDVLTGERHLWRGARQQVRLDPQTNPAAVFRVVPFRHVEYASPSF